MLNGILIHSKNTRIGAKGKQEETTDLNKKRAWKWHTNFSFMH